MTWEDRTMMEKRILLIAYAAKEINLNGDGSIFTEDLRKIEYDISNLNEKALEVLRWRIKDSKEECQKLIYGTLHGTIH